MKILSFTYFFFLVAFVSFAQKDSLIKVNVTDSNFICAFNRTNYHKRNIVSSKGIIYLFRYNEKYDLQIMRNEWMYFDKKSRLIRKDLHTTNGMVFQSSFYRKDGSIKSMTDWNQEIVKDKNPKTHIRKVSTEIWSNTFYWENGMIRKISYYKHRKLIPKRILSWIWYNKNGVEIKVKKYS